MHWLGGPRFAVRPRHRVEGIWMDRRAQGRLAAGQTTFHALLRRCSTLPITGPGERRRHCTRALQCQGRRAGGHITWPAAAAPPSRRAHETDGDPWAAGQAFDVAASVYRPGALAVSPGGSMFRGGSTVTLALA